MVYTVKQGDTIKKIALENGFFKWETIWLDDANKTLREQRSNPHVLYPDDVVQIPEIQRKEVSCATEKHHIFQVPVLKEKLRICVEQSRGHPMAEKPFELTLDGTLFSGTTDGDGMIDIDIPISSEEGELRIEGCVWPLKIGHLNPVDETTGDNRVSGAQARLNNLGYDCGDIDGAMNDRTRESIRAFQADQGFTEDKQTGELDDETCAALKRLHGS